LSSILKALKKIEIQSRETAPADHRWSAGVDTRKILTASTARQWRVQRYGSYAVVLLILLCGGWLIWTHKQTLARFLPFSRHEINPGGVAVSGRPSPAAQTSSPGIRSNARPAASETPSSMTKMQATTAGSAAATRQRPTVARPAGPPLATAPESAPRIEPAPGSAAPARQGKPSQTPVPAAPKSTSKDAAQPPTTYDNLERFSGDALSLQAIAWARDPAQRMAVINDRILREGDSVDGFVVRRIRAEDVIVKDPAGSYRLEFGLQRP
jgi:hypothetical protein